MSKTEKATREYLETLSKDQVINLCLQYIADKQGIQEDLSDAEEHIDNLYLQLREQYQVVDTRGIEINIRNQKISDLRKELQDCKNSLKRKTQSNRDLQRLKHSVNTQFVISQLEEIKEMLSIEYKRYPIVYDKTDDLVGGALDREKVFEIIEQQISKLKGDGNEK